MLLQCSSCGKGSNVRFSLDLQVKKQFVIRGVKQKLSAWENSSGGISRENLCYNCLNRYISSFKLTISQLEDKK